MNPNAKSLVAIIICMIVMILSGCSESQKAKKATEKILKEHDGSVINFDGDFYEGYAPAFMNEQILKLAKDLNEYMAAEEKYPAIKEAYDKSYYWDFITRDRYFDTKRKVDKIPLTKDAIRKAIAVINHNRPKEKKILGLIEYDTDDGSENFHHREIILYNRGKYEMPQTSYAQFSSKYNQYLTACQLEYTDTIIKDISKEEIKKIVESANDPAVSFLFKDSIQ